MTRITRLRSIGALAIGVGALTFVTAAPAAGPKRGAAFRGTTSAPPIEGFHAPVTFKVAANGLSLHNFTYGSFGCFGVGGFRPGVNPYTGTSLIDAGKVEVSAGGHIDAHALSGYSVDGQSTLTRITVVARFVSPRSLSGTITYSQTVTGTVHSSCGPAKLSFSAKAG